METIKPKHEMSEEDIKLNFITPALLERNWKNRITMETQVQFTDGRIDLQGNKATRRAPKRADYILYFNSNNPIAIVEAKDNNHTVLHGLSQAIEYAKALNIPFAYSSNGSGFAEYDLLTQKNRDFFPMDEFPTYEVLVNRYKQESNLSETELKVINQPYYSSQSLYPPRYYQQIAINKTLDAIAKGQNRLLLVMATGTGKTYTAFQIVYRLLEAKMKKKVLYLADRNILVDQTIQKDFLPLTKVVHKVNYAQDSQSKAKLTAYNVYFALYQQLIGENDEDHFKELFQPDFFDLIIVDECHRGSAKEDSR